MWENNIFIEEILFDTMYMIERYRIIPLQMYVITTTHQ